MGLTDRRAAGLAIILMTAAVRGLALERLLNRDSPSIDDAFALQKRQTEEFFRALLEASAAAKSLACPVPGATAGRASRPAGRSMPGGAASPAGVTVTPSAAG